MDLRRLKYFVTLTEELHFGRAATRLHIAQPGLTQNIKQMESMLGIELFVRSSRSVELTEGGRVLLEEAKRLLLQASLLEERMRAFKLGRTARLRLSYSRSASGGVSSAIVDSLRAAEPELRLEINSQPTARSIEQLLEGQLEAAFIRSPLDLETHAHRRLRTILIDTEPLVIGLPRDHPLARRRRIRKEALFDEPLVTGSSKRAPGFYRSMFEQIWGEQQPRIVLREADEEHMLRAVSAGVGLTILPQSRAELIHVPGVVIRHFYTPEPQAELSIAWVDGNPSPGLSSLVAIASTFARNT
ncbi:LysR family transcriptional regulator [Variovorax boronicumulans]|uniref:LysR family transcriptional regulator n=1 Tax=Variovorax boronicumulans TaxID=436515 RepID=UPI001C57D718